MCPVFLVGSVIVASVIRNMCFESFAIITRREEACKQAGECCDYSSNKRQSISHTVVFSPGAGCWCPFPSSCHLCHPHLGECIPLQGDRAEHPAGHPERAEAAHVSRLKGNPNHHDTSYSGDLPSTCMLIYGSSRLSSYLSPFNLTWPGPVPRSRGAAPRRPFLIRSPVD